MATKTFLKFKPQTDLASDRYHKLFLLGIVVSPIPACQWKTFSTFAIQHDAMIAMISIGSQLL